VPFGTGQKAYITFFGNKNLSVLVFGSRVVIAGNINNSEMIIRSRIIKGNLVSF
jgi:hypothetical protein